MNIVRHISPNGAPIIVQSELDEDGEVVRDTVKLFPILPTDPPTVGDEIETVETVETIDLNEEHPLDDFRNNQPPYPYNEIS